jgi:hypothetical protein
VAWKETIYSAYSQAPPLRGPPPTEVLAVGDLIAQTPTPTLNKAVKAMLESEEGSVVLRRLWQPR